MTDREFLDICLGLDTKKVCPKCSVDKFIGEYYERSGRPGQYNAYCKPCHNNARLISQQKRKNSFIIYKGGCCQICNYDKYDGALAFHHLDPNEKEILPAKLNNMTFEKAKPELDKCVLLCHNCHSEVHAGLHLKYLIE
jgi:hypothetical protein